MIVGTGGGAAGCRADEANRTRSTVGHRNHNKGGKVSGQSQQSLAMMAAIPGREVEQVGAAGTDRLGES